MSSEEEELVSALADFDLERTDTLLYIALLQTGSSTVNTLSAKLGFDKGKIYRSLHRLQNMGLASATFSNPTICTALNPEKSLTGIIQRKEEQILSMQKRLEKITKSISRFKNPHEEVSQIPSFYVIQGRPNVYARIGSIIEESVKPVYIVTTIQDLIRMNYTAIPEKITSCRKNNSQIRIITELDSDPKLLEEIEELDATIRLCPLPSKSRLIVAKDTRLVMSGVMNDSMSLNDDVDSILYTNSHDIIANMYSYCNHLWETSKPLKVKSSIKQEMSE